MIKTFIILLLVTISALRAHGETIYDPDPGHPWNQLNRTLFARSSSDQASVGLDDVDILFWTNTTYLLTEPSHSRALRALDRFIEADEQSLIQDPVKRVLLQRDLWALHDWAAARPSGTQFNEQRTQLRCRIVRVMYRLSLDKAQILSLPNSISLAETTLPAFPAGMFSPQGSWLVVGTHESLPTASIHTADFGSRSVFIVLVSFPQGRSQAVSYLHRLRAANHNLSAMHNEVRRLFQLPEGTRWALIRFANTVDRTGHLRTTPIVESLQLRTYIADHGDPNRARSNQVVTEFVFSRRNRGLLRQIEPNEVGFQFVQFRSLGIDEIELAAGDRAAGPNLRAKPFLSTCSQCHSEQGVLSIRTYLPFDQPRALYPSNIHREGRIARRWSTQQPSWIVLQQRWRNDRQHC